MLVGSASSNLVILSTLDELTREAEFWLLTNPCPVDGVESGLSKAIEFLMAFGRLMADFEGDFGAADDGSLASSVQSVCLLLHDFKSTAAICWG
jgi:hypothetical protein